MAISNKERVGRGLDVLRGALRPIVEQEFCVFVAFWSDIESQGPSRTGHAITGGLFDETEE